MRSSLTSIVVLAALLGGCALLPPRVAQPIQIRERVHLAPIGPASPEQLDAAKEVIEERLTRAGIEARVEHTEAGILVVVDAADRERASRLATTPGKVAMVPIPPEFSSLVVDGQPLPDAMHSVPILTNEDIASATLGEEPTIDQPAVDFELSPEGGRIFDAHAAAHLGERFAIMIDGIVVPAPSINTTHFDGRGQISGNFTLERAQELAAVFAAGPLPIELATPAVLKGEPSA
jgi:preprotein translocase subunit SecD